LNVINKKKRKKRRENEIGHCVAVPFATSYAFTSFC
jgi:hypothetical protein